MSEKLSLVSKIAKIRLEVTNATINKSGENKYAGFKYFELSDILPACNKLCEKYSVIPVYCFFKEEAVLTIYDGESNEEIRFVISTDIEDINARMGMDKQSRGMQPVQRLGSVNTYCRRYLYVNFLDLVENDSIDPLEQKQESATKEQIEKISKFSQNNQNFVEYFQKTIGHCDPSKLTMEQADFLITQINKSEEKRKNNTPINKQVEPNEQATPKKVNINEV